jgi:hypothetical protein
MKERPILFSGEMVRAILEGRKTQTRRLVKESDVHGRRKLLPGELNTVGEFRKNPHGVLSAYLDKYPGVNIGEARCPFGEPGDHLWVRETLQLIESDDEEWAWGYAADGELISFDRVNDTTLPFAEPLQKWPSIHMPRWASRITLEVVSVKVERLQDISVLDALAEGITCPDCGYTLRDAGIHLDHGICINKWLHESKNRDAGDHPAIKAFAELWDSTYGKKPGCSWADNPFVWAGEFKVVQP